MKAKLNKKILVSKAENVLLSLHDLKVNLVNMREFDLIERERADTILDSLDNIISLARMQLSLIEKMDDDQCVKEISKLLDQLEDLHRVL